MQAEEAELVDLELRAGESVLFHGWTCHGSPPNTSARRRCGITIIYCSGEVHHTGHFRRLCKT
jgi:ectoine hydroxylase-related dioxygenase (phytanoyl-CoA dioxygenase family)